MVDLHKEEKVKALSVETNKNVNDDDNNHEPILKY